MVLLKATRFGFLLLLAAFIFWENLFHVQFLNTSFSKEVIHAQLSHSHGRQRRNVSGGLPHFTTNADFSAPDSFSVLVELVLAVNQSQNINESSQLIDQLRNVVKMFTLPLSITADFTLTGLHLTTVCNPHSAGRQRCQCEDEFKWPSNICDTFEACDASAPTCDCIYSLPSDGPFCQPKTFVDIVLGVFDPNGTDPSLLMIQLRNAVNRLSLPNNITNDIVLTSLNLTTGCYATLTENQVCQCEKTFAWPCDFCDTFGACSNVSTETCDCINAIPQVGQYCQPISLTTPCPPPPKPIEASVDILLTVTDPNDTNPSQLIRQLRDAVKNVSFPSNITNDIALTSLNLTTTCFRNSLGEQQCRCEEQYTWPCEFCVTSRACSEASPQNCTCINGFPPNGQFCNLNTSNTTCPPPTTPPPIVPSSSPPQPDRKSLSVIIDINFDPLFNERNNPVYMTFSSVIKRQANIYIPRILSAEITNFSAGSTIGNFQITANTTIKDPAVEALLAGILNELRSTFPVVFKSLVPLDFKPPQVFVQNTLVVTCGSPPKELGIPVRSVEWQRDGVVIKEDEQHIFKTVGGNATLTISKYSVADDGLYQCQIFGQNITFRQKSKEKFKLLETPVIQVRPLLWSTVCVLEQQVSLECSVQSPYKVEFPAIPNTGADFKIQHQLTITDCSSTEMMVICQVHNFTQFSQQIRLRLLTGVVFACVDDPHFGNGVLNEIGRASCKEGDVGEMTAICRESGNWENRQDNCINGKIYSLLIQSTFLTEAGLPEFLNTLNQTTQDLSLEVAESPNNIVAIVTILDNVGNFVTRFFITLNRDSMEDVLLTVGILTIDAARPSWDSLNLRAVTKIPEPRIVRPRNESASSLLLFSVESITSRLTNASFDIETPFILLKKKTIISSFKGDLNSTVEIDIPETVGPTNLTVITFESMDNVLSPRDENNSTNTIINGRVVLLQSTTIVDNITFVFDIINETLGSPQCVFWNFTLFEGLGGWDNEGCELVGRDNETVTCQCDHLTSFSILMSPFALRSRVLDFITYIGVSISMASLVICLCIEAAIWKKIRRSNTSHLRHISIVNIALSLLIANIWFIIGASISEGPMTNPGACTAATFFIHFFYLALFFWMLASALLLLYRTVSVFEGGLSKSHMMAIGFCLGYGAPLLIAVITIAVTAPNNTYIQETVVCWLNWNQSKALLAFVIPVLVIVFINLVILIVVVIKILQSQGMTNTAQRDEKYALVVIIRTLTVLTPFFGLTWSLGVGTLVNPRNIGIHIAFAFFNSLQGFFILVFGTLLDKKVRSEMSFKSLTSGTRTTSGNSSSGWQFFKNLGKKGGRNVSSSDSGVASSNYPQSVSASRDSGIGSEAVST